MAHRLQFSKDLILPKDIQQQRVTLQKQIQKVRQRQKLLIQDSNQRLMLLEHRLVHGKKKKIFTFDKQMNRMTLGDQISHYNMEIAKLNAEIVNEQRAIRDSQGETNDNKNIQDYLVKEVVLETTGMRKEAIDMLIGSGIMRETFQGVTHRDRIVEAERMSIRRSASKELRLTTISSIDPQQQLMSLTHQIIRLKKSLQQVRSKYSENFTQYKLKQQLQKLKTQNQQIALQLRQLQMNKKIVNEAISAKNQSQVNYDQLEVTRARKEFEILERERNLLREYWQRLDGERVEREQSDERRVRGWKEDRVRKLEGEVNEVKKHNQILWGQIELTEKEIQRSNEHYMRLRGRIL